MKTTSDDEGVMSEVEILRFCGVQTHPVEAVEVYVSHGEPTLLNLELHCGEATQDTAPEGERCGWTSPSVEVWVPVPSLEPAELDDLEVTIPWAYLAERDARNRLYVFEHEDFWDIRVKLGVRDGEVHVAFEGRARDPNHYRGDAPDARVSGAARFPLPR